MGAEQLPRTEFQHQSRPRQQQPEANRGRPCWGDQGMGFEAWERGIFPNRGIPCPPTLRKSARVRALARDLTRTDGRTQTPKATPRGEPKGGRRRREEREGSRRASTQREFLCAREGMEEREREGRDASDGRAGWCRRKCAVDPSTSERLRPPPTRRVEREQLPAGPGGMGPPVGDGLGWWLSVTWRVVGEEAGPGCRCPGAGLLARRGEARGREEKDVAATIASGGLAEDASRAAREATAHKWDGDGVVVSLSALRAVRGAGRPGGRRRFGFPGGTQEDHELRWPPGSELTPNIESTSEQVS